LKVLFIKTLVLASFFIACGNGDEPDNLIDKEKMIELLTETHILEAKVGRLSVNEYDSANVAFQYLQERLWEKQDVDSLSYNESYNYYAKYPKEFSEMYERVEENLVELEKVDNENAKAKNND
jgi:hypothetical protein